MNPIGRRTILIDIAPNLLRVMADRQRIVQVLNNLLSNATLPAPESTPIRVTTEHDRVHVTVTPRASSSHFGSYL